MLINSEIIVDVCYNKAYICGLHYRRDKMGLFDTLTKVINTANQIKNIVEDGIDSKGSMSTSSQGTTAVKDSNSIVIAPGSHRVEDTVCGDDRDYTISYMINDSFKDAKSHAAEVEMLSTYAPNSEYGDEGTYPYVAIQLDDTIYSAVDEFKKTGKIKNAIECTALSGQFYFKAKMSCGDDIIYFYGFDKCGELGLNSGLGMFYKKAMLNTQDEKKLMKVLDDVAASYSES